MTDTLEHYGVPGMKWGRRKAKDTSPQDVTVEAKPGGLIKAKGGGNQKQSQDAIDAAIIKQVAKKSSVDSLSNADLKKLNERMNLEQNFSRLAEGDRKARMSAAEKFIDALLSAAKQEVSVVAKQQATKQVKGALENRDG